MKIVIVGGGICGLALAINLHRRGIDCMVYERAPEIKELGVGITLLPHAMREFTALGVGPALEAAGIENRESCFFNRFGQLIYQEDRGRFDGYDYPEIAIHRGRLHTILFKAAAKLIGRDHITTGHTCVSVRQTDSAAIAEFVDTQTQARLNSVEADAVIACDGVNSVIRKQYISNDRVAFAGINTWRGVTRHKPILTGRSYVRIGSILTGKMVVYPIINDIDGHGNQLINWMAEIKQDTCQQNEWNRLGNIEDFYGIYEGWKFDWLDVSALIRNAEQVLEYPMVDKDPIERWTFGRVTFAGDSAHPMYPRGSNGAAQAAIDARTLADELAKAESAPMALRSYEDQRRPATAAIVQTNREQPPDYINIKVEQLVGDRPFDNLNEFISQKELRTLSERYKQVAGFAKN